MNRPELGIILNTVSLLEVLNIYFPNISTTLTTVTPGLALAPVPPSDTDNDREHGGHQ